VPDVVRLAAVLVVGLALGFGAGWLVFADDGDKCAKLPAGSADRILCKMDR
jgi:hypothetical protein